MKEKIAKLIEAALEENFPDIDASGILVEYPKEKNHGDYSSGVVLRLAKILKKSPQEIAEKLSEKIKEKNGKIFEKIEVVNGFINFFISKDFLQKQVAEILKEKEKFGDSKIGKAEKINVEFISANPTGPLTLGNGRGGFCGDVLANVLEKSGYKVTREYYINNRGAQIIKLGHSVLGDKDAVYKGEYITKLREKILQGRTSQNSAEKVGEKAAKYILEKMIKPTIKRMNIKFDVWFSEKKLYQKKEVDRAIKELAKKGFTYISEGAVWFKCKELEDDKDRVLIRKDGIKTYFASDIAYLKNKFKRGFSQLVFFLGADHYGYVPRLLAAAGALGFEKAKIIPIVMQMVRLFEKGKEVKMSKRAGIYITIDELLDEVGLDVARFFFLTKNPGTHLNFDLELAKEQSEKNPVYYVQYAHARIASIITKSKIKNQKSKLQIKNQKLNFLNHPAELSLIKQLVKFPEVVEDTATDYQIQRLPQYAVDLADAFHRFYENCRVIPAPYRTEGSGAGTEDETLTQARLGLVLATKIVLKNTLSLMGISSPEKM